MALTDLVTTLTACLAGAFGGCGHTHRLLWGNKTKQLCGLYCLGSQTPLRIHSKLWSLSTEKALTVLPPTPLSAHQHFAYNFKGFLDHLIPIVALS